MILRRWSKLTKYGQFPLQEVSLKLIFLPFCITTKQQFVIVDLINWNSYTIHLQFVMLNCIILYYSFSLSWLCNICQFNRISINNINRSKYQCENLYQIEQIHRHQKYLLDQNDYYDILLFISQFSQKLYKLIQNHIHSNYIGAQQLECRRQKINFKNIQFYFMLGRVFKSWSVIEPDTKQKQKDVPTRKNEQLLPNQISGRILDLEMQCQKQTISKEVVFELIAEYSKAVQFYEQQGNEKYKLYQKRMHNFLAKPMVASILKGQSGEMVIKKQRKQQTIRKAENKAQEEVKQLLQKQQQKQKKHDSFVKQQLNKQQEVLQERIRRKRIMSNRSQRSKQSDTGNNNQQSGKKEKQQMNVKLLLAGIDERSKRMKKVFL